MSSLVYIIDTSLISKEDTEKFSNSLPLSRLACFNSKKTEKEMINSFAASFLLGKCFDYFNIPRSATIEKNKFGKPYLVDYETLHFSLSHSFDRVMCAMSDFEIGCDCEKVRDIDLHIADRFYSIREKAYMENSDNHKEREEAFFKIWTLKESYIKCIGTGLSTPLTSFSVVFDSNGQNDELSRNFTFKEFLLNDGYKYAICGKGALRPISGPKMISLC